MSGRRSLPRHRLAAGLLSLLLPGLGQLCTGRVRRGLGWLAVSLALASALLVLATDEASLARLLEPRALLWLLAANAAVGVFRAAAVADAARPHGSHPSGRVRRAGAALALGVLLALALAPHAIAGLYGWQTHRILSTVFVPATPGPTADAVPAPEATAAPTVTEPTVTTRPSASEPATPAAEPSPPRWAGGERLTVALLGSDAGPGRSGARTDAMLVVSLHLARGDVAVFSAPRNLTDYPVAERAALVRDRHCPTSGGWQQLSALYNCLDRNRQAASEQYPDAPDPAARGVADTLGVLTGLTVDHYVLVDLSGFVRVVDALGGVTVHVGEPVRTRLSPAEDGGAWIDVDIPAGEQTLDGRQALGFVRSRTGTDDYDRMRRQRCLIGSLASSTEAGTLVRAFPALAGVVVDHVATDIPVDRLPDLLRLRDLVDLDALVTVGFGPPRYQGTDKRPDVERIRTVVQQALDDPASLRGEQAGAEGLREVCG
jgi:LCP family protein required for cell wall assembly